MTDVPRLVAIDKLAPHPGNPRLVEQTELIAQLATLMRAHGFDAAHAIIVRPLGDGFQIVSGHNRVKAATAVGLSTVPAWVREMDDDKAYMQLVLANTQSELSPIERGVHAKNSGKDVRHYAADVGRPERTVLNEVWAAGVADAVATGGDDLSAMFVHLVEVHAARPWLWPALVTKVVKEGQSRVQTRELVRGFKEAPKEKWAFDWNRIGERVVAGSLTFDHVREMLTAFERYVALLAEEGEHPDTLLPGTVDVVVFGDKAISSPSQLEQVLRPLIREVEDKRAAARAATLGAQERAVPLFTNVSLTEWHELDEATRRILLDPRKAPATGTFNQQKGDGIEWAAWSWNPITGCLHDCPYCYARDIATLGNTARAFPHGFAPAFKPVQLNTPHNVRPPKGAERDQRLRNVFCGSMSDWWGRWVPDEWVRAVLTAIDFAPWWTFLTLTKFPKRMAEFELPANMWAGTTIDCQARVRNAESAMATIKAKYRWGSIEPMLEDLRFTRIELFDWLVIGGASASSRTPEWKPPLAWIINLLAQAREANVPVYMKPNLLGHRVLEMPGGLPVPQDYPPAPPPVFDYLSDKRTLEAKPLSPRRLEESA